MQNLLSIFVVFFLAVASAYVAQEKGRHPAAWFFLGVFLGIFALIILYFLPSLKNGKEVQAQSERKHASTSVSRERKSRNTLPRDHEKKQWFFLTKEGEQMGPLGFIDLRDKMQSGVIDDDTFVWCEDMEQWHRLGDLALLREPEEARL